MSRDIMTIPPAEVLQTEVLRTVVGGRTVWEKATEIGRASCRERV